MRPQSVVRQTQLRMGQGKASHGPNRYNLGVQERSQPSRC